MAESTASMCVTVPLITTEPEAIISWMSVSSGSASLSESASGVRSAPTFRVSETVFPSGCHSTKLVVPTELPSTYNSLREISR